MDADERGGDPSRIGRREAIRRAAVATGVAWSAPVLTSLRAPAFAQYGGPCEPACSYVAHFELPSVACSPCEDICHFADCGSLLCPNPCTGSACDRITSVTCLGDNLRVCTDCELDQTGGVYTLAPEECDAGGSSVGHRDPADPEHCVIYDLLRGGCQCGGRCSVNVSFRCLVC